MNAVPEKAKVSKKSKASKSKKKVKKEYPVGDPYNNWRYSGFSFDLPIPAVSSCSIGKVDAWRVATGTVSRSELPCRPTVILTLLKCPGSDEANDYIEPLVFDEEGLRMLCEQVLAYIAPTD
jgi:hypothetical protein